MKELTILHLSDLHISSEDKNIKIPLIKKLIIDCKNNIDNNIDLIIFTGDLVRSGDEINYNIASQIIEMLLNEFSISSEKFLYIPGNHEVQINDLKDYYFMGLQQKYNKQTWEYYNFETDSDLCHQMKNYKEFNYAVNFNNDIVSNTIFDINNMKIGITSINSAWFSRGKTSDDKGIIFIPINKIKKCYDGLQECELKIAIMHHPYNLLNYEFINDIERELGKYDLVLSGHSHDDNIKSLSTIFGNKALFITGNELGDGINNGYGIYRISIYEQIINVKLRKYFKKRESFDTNNEIVEGGTYSYSITSVSNHDKELYNLFINTKQGFKNSLDGLMVTNVLETSLNNDFKSSFIMPKLTIANNESNYETKRETISFEELLKDEYERVILLGKKEVGKTVLANYIAQYYYNNFNELKKIPVILNGENLKVKNKNELVKAIRSSLNDYSNDSYSVSNNKINSFLESDSLIIIIDDFPKDDNSLNEILINLKLSKMYFLIEDSLSSLTYVQTTEILNKITETAKSLNVYIEEFTKNQIRRYSKSLLAGTSYNVDELCTRTVSLFNEMSLPKTPFAVSLFISICSINSDFEPTNKAKIVEKLIEILLEKLSPNDIYLKTYGFDSKCSFLACMAYDMYNKNQYYYTINDFHDFVVNYHKEKMFPLSDTKFNKLFFEKNVLIEKNGKVMFRFKCFINYFLALYFSKNNHNILTLAESEKYYNYDELFEYFSGINKDMPELAECISIKLEKLIENVPNLNELLNLSLLHSKLLDDLNEENVDNLIPYCEEEKDDLTDININSDYDPTLIDTSKEKLETEKLIYTLHILGSIVKNSEEFSGNDKIKYLKNFMTGIVCLMGKMIESFKDILFQLRINIINKYGSKYDNEKELKINKLFEEFIDMVKLTTPLIIQSFVLETVGTRKLRNVIENLIESNENKESYDFLNYICLYADLKIENWDRYFSEFIDNIKNYSMQSFIIVKCYNYLEMNYFNDDLKKTKNILLKIYRNKGISKNKANNVIDNHIKCITLNNNSDK